MSYVHSTTNSGGSGTTPYTAVPTGVQADDIVLLIVAVDDKTEDLTSLWPSGFTQLYNSNITAPDGQTAAIGWKRLTGADSGSYTFTGDMLWEWVCQAIALRGRHLTDPPVATENLNEDSNSSPVSIVATGVTALAGDDLVWVSAPDVSGSGYGNLHDNITNYTEVQDVENGWANLCIKYRLNVSAGATGDISGNFNLSSGSAGYIAYLVRVPRLPGSASLSPSASPSRSPSSSPRREQHSPPLVLGSF